MVVGLTMARQGEVHLVEPRAQPAGGVGVQIASRRPQHLQAGQGRQVCRGKPIVAFGRVAAGARDELAQRLVAPQIFDQQHQARAIGELKFTADDEAEVGVLFGFIPGAHHAGQRARVGQCQAAILLRDGGGGQLIRRGGAAQEAEG